MNVRIKEMIIRGERMKKVRKVNAIIGLYANLELLDVKEVKEKYFKAIEDYIG